MYFTLQLRFSVSFVLAYFLTIVISIVHTYGYKTDNLLGVYVVPMRTDVVRKLLPYNPLRMSQEAVDSSRTSAAYKCRIQKRLVSQFWIIGPVCVI